MAEAAQVRAFLERYMRVRLFRLVGPSMLPTIRSHGDLALADQCLHDLSRGDVVVFRKPTDCRITVIKRLIAMPGDWIKVPSDKWFSRKIPEGHCWVEGDNARQSVDSRTYGPVPLGLMEGRVTHIVWPPYRISRLDRMVPEGRIMPRK